MRAACAYKLAASGRRAQCAIQQLVVCGPGLPPGATAEQRRAVGILSAARQLDLRRLGNQLGGTLIVDDASYKQDVQKALKEGNLSFGFSAGGCLFPYYIGCAGALIDAGILTDPIKLGGASAGSLLAACIKSQMPLDDIVEQNLRLMADLRKGGTRGRLGAVLRSFLEEHLPHDAHVHCKDRAYVAVTKVVPLARPVLVADWSDRNDLIESLLTSCHIPFWLDGNAFRMFRGERHCDGGLTNFIPIPPGTVGVRVCCFPSKQLSPVYRIGISPDSFEPWPYTLRQMVQWAFEPADETIVTALIDKGKRDTVAWMESMELVGHKEEAEVKDRQDAGQVAAAKAAAIGTDDAAMKERAKEEGEQRLEARAQQGELASQPPRAAAMAGEVPATEQREQGGEGATEAQQQAMQAAAEVQDAGGSKEEQEAAAERALREAEEKEAQEGNIWAKALSAAGVAASAAAVATAVTKGAAVML